MRQILLGLILFGMIARGAAAEIVVLTETPVAEFTLPDGTVLANAYAWRKSSQGIMIMHDDGSYFLNFKLLPDDWKTAYLGGGPEEQSAESPGVETAPEPDVEVEAEPEPERDERDRYRIRPLLESVPDLDPESLRLLLTAPAPGETDQQLLMLGVLQSLLTDKEEIAKRLRLTVEERGYERDEMDPELLFRSCRDCQGNGKITRECKTCDGEGKCQKCGGVGTRKSSFDDSRLHCTACRGEGDCLDCRGKGGLSRKCPSCKGTGKRVSRPYCEVLRNHLVRAVRVEAVTNSTINVITSESSGMAPLLKRLPGLDPDARDFYLSDEYAGGMDTNIVAACLMDALLRKDFDPAERAHLMLTIGFTDKEPLELEKYLKPCSECDSTGASQRKCRRCTGSGDCARCEGAGDLPQKISDVRIHCTACRGTGKCPACRGKGLFRVKCKTCDGRGRTVVKQRVEIKLELLVDRLNAFPSER